MAKTGISPTREQDYPEWYQQVIKAADMADAVRQAAAASVPGDVVLLSPACSSFDMYASYALRGEDFCKQVRALK